MDNSRTAQQAKTAYVMNSPNIEHIKFTDKFKVVKMNSDENMKLQ